jgi:calcium/calmodulin-dependent protein kinase I
MDSERDMIFNEINFIRELRMCENIVQIDRVYSTINLEDRKRVICLVMKYAKYGSLLKHILRNQKYTEHQIRTIMEQLLLAVDLMHRSNIIHRDIKPDNILLMDRENLKICISDLGLACRGTDLKETHLKCGTPGYVGPEILKGHPFSFKSDIFSVGSFMYNLLTSNSLY